MSSCTDVAEGEEMCKGIISSSMHQRKQKVKLMCEKVLIILEQGLQLARKLPCPKTCKQMCT